MTNYIKFANEESEIKVCKRNRLLFKIVQNLRKKNL